MFSILAKFQALIIFKRKKESFYLHYLGNYSKLCENEE